MQAKRSGHCSAAILSGKLDIANSLHKAGTIEIAAEGLEEVRVIVLPDSGADVNMVTESLVSRLESLKLISRFPLDEHIDMGSVSDKNAFTITHAVQLPVRLGDLLTTELYGVAPIPAPPHVVCGTPWLDKHCPQAMSALRALTDLFTTLPDSQAQMMAAPAEVSPISTPALSPQRSSGASTPLELDPPTPVLAFGPCKDPSAAFRAGGGLSSHAQNLAAALEAEAARRESAQEWYENRLIAQTELDLELSRKKDEETDPGVRGLTGNSPGWEQTIPAEVRHFAESVFSDASRNRLPPLRPGWDLVVQLKDDTKFHTARVSDMSREQLQVMKAVFDDELRRGFAVVGHGPYSTTPFFVRDPPSESRNQGQLRLVFDFRPLNANSVPDNYPIPLARQIFQDIMAIGEGGFLTVVDAAGGFSNIRVHPDSQKYLAVKTQDALLEPTVVPMGYLNAPAVFQRFINHILHPHFAYCRAYLDDIVIFSRTKEEHVKHLNAVLQTLKENQISLKPKKCKWFRKKVSFLGYTVELGKGFRMSDDKIQALRDLKPPRHKKDLHTILGQFGWLAHLIPHYSDITACLTTLLQKDVPWTWDPALHGRAWERLLAGLRDDVFLNYHDPDKPCRLHSDASNEAYGVIIMQQDDKEVWRPTVMCHHKFKAAEKGWDVADKELYAIVYALDRYRHFLARPVGDLEVYTDHRNLAKFMFTTNLLKSHDGRLGRWWEKLSQFPHLKIMYQPGVDNPSDWLTRYGYDDTAAVGECTLLPASRFSEKALTDIVGWFKKSAADPNIRQTLERAFSKASGSLVPVAKAFLAKIRTAPVHPVVQQVLASSLLAPSALSQRTRLFSSLSRYAGAHLDSLLPNPAHCRSRHDRRGLGA